jgi:hypothetical protein
MVEKALSDAGEGQLFVAATTQLEGARTLAESVGGALYADGRANWDHLPFRGLLVVSDARISALEAVGDVGVYRAQSRVLKSGRARVFGLFPMRRAPGLSHEQADAHWRDIHGPLALMHHGHMTEYIQFSVIRTLAGTTFDGFALCGFATEDDLRQRFYSTPDGPAAIAEDVQRFADVKLSPRRLVVRVQRFASAP